MGLTCSCPEWEGEGWGYWGPDDYTTLQTKRRRRCCSCKKFIDIGAICTEFTRYRYPRTDMEAKIYGEEAELPLASWYMCEECSDLFFSFEGLGFCVMLGGDSMQELLRAYVEEYGPRKEEK